MIEMRTEVEVKGVSGMNISDFMLNCTDEDYQNWWPGTHLAFNTLKRFPNNLGNIVCFDEYVGKHRLKFEGIVVKSLSGKEIVWQMKKVMRLPAWLVLEFKDIEDGVVIAHTIKVGFEGIGRVLDPLLRLYLNKDFENDLEKHAHIEFTKLAEIL
ncbi:hypothetical protein ACFL1Z_08205 [Thermodesulfobacteriota bacterium]